MFKKRLITIILSIFIFLGTLTFSQNGANAAGVSGWQLNNSTWNYYIGGNKFTGWLSWGDKWYFLDGDGNMKSGWITDGESRYYLNQGGDMAIGWKLIDNTWYYLNGNGTMKTGWLSWNGKEYYLNAKGDMAVSTTTPDGYVVGPDGACVLTESAVFTVTVETPQDFVNAIGSNKKIILKPGIYNLSSISQINRSDNTVRWDIVNDGKELNISNIRNLTIEGMDSGKVEIKVDPRYAAIIQFTNVNNVTIKNIVAGHTPSPYTCNAGVFLFNNSNDISIINSELYGCGSIGLNLRNVKRLNAANCIIDHCSLRAIAIRDSEDIKFTESFIVNHEAYSNIVDIYGGRNIIFEKCGFANNNNFSWSFIEATNNSNVLLDTCLMKNNTKSVDPKYNTEKIFFFKTTDYDGTSNSKITIRNSEFIDNICDYIGDNEDNIILENCVGEGNVWE